ncbi:UPF0104 family protein [Pseudomonas sp. PDM18]|uniref:lysylphosphatidylglycerol synthase transmembrane domain-containing protein n=1 Tax=Pseudomonas sp. PDM18 TaxID=2769253 RepID=UPI001781E7BC|nr:YbhN family protein [Pseudomonas sp. PDM18]MBD9676852.1 UPF0104 family protein [Pseudomonas sp. PDM18]
MQTGKLIKKAIAPLTAILFLAFCYLHKEAFRNLTSFPPDSLLCIVALYLLFHLTNALVLKQLSDKINPAGNLLFFVGVNQISSAWNYVAPLRLAQFGSRALLLKKHLQISISQSAAQFSIASIFNVICNVAATLLILFIEPQAVPNALLLTLAGLATLGGMATCLYLPRLSRSNASWMQELAGPFQVLRGMDAFKLLSLNSIQITLSTAITYVLFQGAGLVFELTDCILIATASVLLSIVSLTPGNLGYKELSLTLLGSWLGLEQGPLLAALMLDRAIQLGLTLSLAAIFSLSLQRLSPP